MTNKADRRDAGAGEACGAPLELMTLDVARINPYEHDPRRVPNVEYHRIKDSIRVDGLTQPLVVTQRPGEAHYIVHAGGNTRLRILKELFEETGEKRFAAIPCVIRPWTREADVLLAHLKENDLRAELTFLDKARAVADAKRFLEEAAGESFTQAQLAEALRRCGYALSQGLISQMAYAVERLHPALSQALEGGLGRPQVAKIRSLDRAARTIWLKRTVATQEEYDQAFETLCRRYDTPEWDIANLRRALEAEIAERADINIHAVSLEIEARLSGREFEPPAREAIAQVDSPIEESTEPGQEGSAGNTQASPVPSVGTGSPAADAGRLVAEATTGAGHQEPVGDQEPENDSAGEKPLVSIGSRAQADVKSLRARLWVLASRLAQRNGLGDLVHPLSGHGLGFVLHDVPDPALIEQLDEDALAQVSMVWWHLAACAELTVAPLEALLPCLPEESVLRRALVDQDAGLLFASVWTLDPGHMGYRLWCRLDDRDWQDLLGLMDTYRALRRNAAADDKNLWSRA
ncbi:MAG: ParB N-terminal domain-containing protein [Nitrococcus sp.]|nr:ParB N-terminal domain-containing protein [Nitrococcus sp.]